MSTLFQKLNFKNQNPVLILNAPTSFEKNLKELSALTNVQRGLDKLEELDYALVFVLNCNEINQTIEILYPKLKGDAVLWFCYPKGSSKKYKSDVNRDNGWQKLGDFGLEPVRQVAIDDDWSALRFRKVTYIKNFTRNNSFALSEEGKERTKKVN